jgi:interferon, gamma-inducible protein 30
MTRSSLAVVAAAAAAAATLPGALALSGKGNVPVALYSESKCPDCAAFAPTYEKVWKTACVQEMVSTFEEVPYGNAQTSPSGKVTCQHGPSECQGNLFEACAVAQSTPTGGQWLPFITCMYADFSSVPAPAQSCASSAGLDWATLNACATGPEGAKLIAANANRTNNLNPPHTYVPWVTVNGTLVPDPPTGGPSEADVIAAICAAYVPPAGGAKPACCPKEAAAPGAAASAGLRGAAPVHGCMKE